MLSPAAINARRNRAGPAPPPAGRQAGGSFVTATPEPNDIDLIVLVYPGHNFAAELRPTEYNVLSRRLVRKHYALDMLMAADGSRSAEDYRRFFSQVRDRPETEKGMLCVRLVAARGGAGGRKRVQR